MLLQSYNMLSVKDEVVKNPPSYRQCRPAPESSKQDSGRAGPENSVLYKHKVWFYSREVLSKHKHWIMTYAECHLELHCN